MDDKNVKVVVEKLKNGKVNLDVSCDHCGKPLTISTSGSKPDGRKSLAGSNPARSTNPLARKGVRVRIPPPAP